MATAVTDDTFKTEVLEADGLVMVDFWAAWCGPCRVLGPVVEQISKEQEGKVKVVKLDVDANPAMAQEYNIRSIPTVAFFKDGEVVKAQSGVAPKPYYEQQIKELG